MILVEIGETMIKLSLAALEATGWERMRARDCTENGEGVKERERR